jgi:hypothetical protein
MKFFDLSLGGLGQLTIRHADKNAEGVCRTHVYSSGDNAARCGNKDFDSVKDPYIHYKSESLSGCGIGRGIFRDKTPNGYGLN